VNKILNFIILKSFSLCVLEGHGVNICPLLTGHASQTNDNIRNIISATHVSDRCDELYSNSHGYSSALGLLASAYDSSDSDDEAPVNISINTEKNAAAAGFANTQSSGTLIPQKSNVQLCHEERKKKVTPLMKPAENESMLRAQAISETDIGHFAELGEPPTSYEQWSAYLHYDDLSASCVNASSDTTLSTNKGSTVPDALAMLKPKYNKDSCKMHVFCLEHAVETWTQLEEIGGANIMILCHPGIYTVPWFPGFFSFYLSFSMPLVRLMGGISD
jgi:hypothetical protein